MPYILHVSIFMAVFSSFYWVLLKNETFYTVSRYLLIVSLLLSFLLPLVSIPGRYSIKQLTLQPNQRALDPGSVSRFEPVAHIQGRDSSLSTIVSYESGLKLIVILYWSGVIIFFLNFIIQLILILKQIIKHEKITDGKIKIVEVSGNKGPCSFGPYIFLNPERYDWATYNEILAHEKQHAIGRHSVDIVLSEMALVVLWFNPFAWLQRRLIEENIEFLTDDLLISQSLVDPKTYQLNLVKVSVHHAPLGLTINYNQSLLSKRILQINTRKSSARSFWKCIMFIPLIILCISSLNKTSALPQDLPSAMVNKSDSFSLVGQVSGTQAIHYVLKYDALNGKHVKDTSRSLNGEFSFKGRISVPTLANLIDLKSWQSTEIFLEPGKMLVKVHNNKLDMIEVSGSKNEQDKAALNQLLQPILNGAAAIQNEYMTFNNKLIQATLMKAHKDSIDLFDKKTTDALHKLAPTGARRDSLIYKFVEEHPASFYAAYMASTFSNGWSRDSSQKLYQKLTPTVKSSIFGQKLLRGK